MNISLAGRKILLIGGAGFIGHNLALKLTELNAEVTIIDGLNVSNYYTLHRDHSDAYRIDLYRRILDQRMALLKARSIPLIQLDARDYHLLSEAIGTIKPDTVIQLAAVAHANRSNKDPYSTFDHSLRTLENALDASRSEKLGVEHFVYLSSSMVYGQFQEQQVTETTACEPLGIYGALKFAGEKLVIAYNQVFDLPYTIIRPSALYGERCISRRVIQIFIENAVKGGEITITGDGSDRLDFTYIQDLVSGLAACLANDAAKNEIFNLTYGQARTLSDVVAVLGDHFPDLSVNYVPKDKLTPDRGTLCVDKMRALIGYQPGYPIEEGIKQYVAWYRHLHNQ